MQRIRINDVEFTVGTEFECKADPQYANIDPYAFMPLGTHGMRIFSHLSWDDIAKAGGLGTEGTYDFAKPQGWYNQQIEARGLDFVERQMYVWFYPHDLKHPNRYSGEPRSLRNLRDDRLYRWTCRVIAGLPLCTNDQFNTRPDFERLWSYLSTQGNYFDKRDPLVAVFKDAIQADEY